MLLNPAPGAFNSWANSHIDISEGLVHMPSGGYCYMGDCGNGTATAGGSHRRMLGASSGGVAAAQWCVRRPAPRPDERGMLTWRDMAISDD